MSGTSQTPIVTFDYSVWAFRYPELAAYVSAPMANAYLGEAGLYLDVSGNGVITDPVQLATLQAMLVAHIAALNAPINGAPLSPLVGRISSANEGSVSVSTDLQVPGSAAYFAQTKYGLSFWAATAAYRTFRYMPRCYRPGLNGQQPPLFVPGQVPWLLV